jgi:hypothetical protein
MRRIKHPDDVAVWIGKANGTPVVNRRNGQEKGVVVKNLISCATTDFTS